jgi:hypothetical protein
MIKNPIEDFGGNVSKALTAAQMALRATEAGRGGLVRAEYDEQNQRILYRLMATGETVDSVEEAFLAASRLQLTQFERVVPFKQDGPRKSFYDSRRIVGTTTNNPRRAQMGLILQQMQDVYDQKMSTDSDFQSFIARVKGSAATADEISLNIISTRTRTGTDAKSFIERAGKELGGYIPFSSDEGIDLLQFSIGDRKLTKSQTHLLLAYLGNDVLNPAKVANVFGAGGSSAEIESYLSKITKRIKGFLSERDITLSSGDIADAMGSRNKHGQLIQLQAEKRLLGNIEDEMGIVIEEGLDVFKKHFRLNSRDLLVGRVMQNVATEGIIDSSIRRMSEQLGKNSDDLNNLLNQQDFQDLIKIATSNSELDSLVEKRFGKNSDMYKFFKDIMDASEKEFDGNAILNKKIFTHAKQRLQQTINSTRKAIEQGAPNAEQLKNALLQLEQQYNILNNAENLEQVTGRGQFGEYSAKIAYTLKDLSDDDLLKNVAFVIGRSGLKTDINLGKGIDSIILSGLGGHKDLTYVDQVTAAFHPEAFATAEDIQNIERYSAQVMQQFQEVAQGTSLPKNILQGLERAASSDPMIFPVEMRASRQRAQEFARSIIELHQSGVAPKDSPQMMNMLHSFFATQAYKTKMKGGVEQLMPAVPGLFRYAISTESVDAMGGGGPSILNNYMSSTGRKGYSDISFKLADGTQQTAELMKFRVSNNRILLHAGAVSDFYNALGGFDLDDKGLPKIMTTGRGKDRDIFFTMVRQPSAIQESIYSSAALDDVETLRHFFGNDDFIDTLAQISNPDDSSRFRHNELYQILTDKKKTNIQGVTESDIKKAILDVYDEMASQNKATIVQADERVLEYMAKYGSSPLYNTEITDRFGLSRLLSTAQQTAEQKSQTFIREELQKILPEYKSEMDNALYQRLASASSEQEFRKIISDSNIPTGLRAATGQSVFDLMENVMVNERDILGYYVNRSMIVGSRLNQLEDFAKQLDADDLSKFAQIKVGLGTQEFAIDRAVNFSMQREFLAQVAERINTLGSMTGVKFVEEAFGTTINQVGEQAMLNVGRQIGAQTVFYNSDKYKASMSADLAPVIDEVLLAQRLQDTDVSNLVKGIIEGMEQTIQETGYQSEQVTKMLEELSKMRFGGDRAMDYLMKTYGAGANHKYASVARLSGVAERTKAAMDALTRLSLAGMQGDQILQGTQIDEKASKAADFLLQRHQQEMDEIFDKSASRLSETDKEFHAYRKIMMGETVAEDIKRASQMAGISQEELINAMEKRAYQKSMRFRYNRLDYLSEDGMNFIQKLGAVRSRRIREFYRRTTEGSYMESIEKAAQAISDQDLTRKTYGQANVEDEVMQILDQFFGEENSEVQNIIRNIENQKNLDQSIVDEISTKTSQTVSSGTVDDTFVKGMNAALDGEDYSRYVAGGKPPYKRISEYIKDGEFKKLFTENATLRRSIYAAGALIAGSFIYSAVKDHTAQDVQGPPLLPGGSAYEEMYPNRSAEIPQIGTVNYNPGVSYKVNLFGGRNQVEMFKERAMELGNFNMNTTMYSGIPDVGRDPFAEMAGSF